MSVVSKLLLLAAVAVIGHASAADAVAIDDDASVDTVQELLSDWGLQSAFGDEFRAAHVDGWALRHIAQNFGQLHSREEEGRYPNAQFFHFAKLRAKLADHFGDVLEQEVASSAGRRRLASSGNSAGGSGLSIRRNDSAISMGTMSDVKLMRSGLNSLTVDADTTVEGGLNVNGDVSVNGSFAIGDDQYPFFPTMSESGGATLDIKVRSRAYDDVCINDDFTGLSNKCASAIVVNGVSTSITSRGHTIMYFDHDTGALVDSGSWDTHGSTTATDDMADFVRSIPSGDIVVVATYDSAGVYEPVHTLANLLTFGVSIDDHNLELREAMCLIGRRGSEGAGSFLPWQQIVVTDRYKGPANCSAVVQTGNYEAAVSGDYDISAAQFRFNGMPIVGNLWIRVLSIGFDDPGYGCVAGTSGCTGPNYPSRVWVNGEYIPFDEDASTMRGHNFIVINQITGEIDDKRSFDTHGDSSAGDNIETFIGNITEGRIVVLALHDAAGNYEHPDSILSLMAGHEFDTDFDLRESFCMIGRKGKVSTNWMTYYYNERFTGPSWCEAAIPLMPPSYNAVFDSYSSEGEHVFSRRALEADAEVEADAADVVD